MPRVLDDKATRVTRLGRLKNWGLGTGWPVPYQYTCEASEKRQRRPGRALARTRQIFQGRGWCCQTGLNCRPLHYQWRGHKLETAAAKAFLGLSVHAARILYKWTDCTARPIKKRGARSGIRCNPLRGVYPSASCTLPLYQVIPLPGPFRKLGSPRQGVFHPWRIRPSINQRQCVDCFD
jgi:hypothetical protein